MKKILNISIYVLVVGIWAIIASFSIFVVIKLGHTNESFTITNCYWRYGLHLLGIALFLFFAFYGDRIKDPDGMAPSSFMTILGIAFLISFTADYFFSYSIFYTDSYKIIKSYSPPKNYDIEEKYGSMYVIMPCPTMGIVGRNEVGYDGFTFDEVEKDLFKMVRRANEGDYNIYVILKYKDSYGNYSKSDTTYVSTLNRDDLRKYAEYSYFAGKSRIDKAFPWNR